LRQLALSLSLYFNVIIMLTKVFAYLQTWSLSVLAALLDSLLDVVSQLVLAYTEKHSKRHYRDPNGETSPAAENNEHSREEEPSLGEAEETPLMKPDGSTDMSAKAGNISACTNHPALASELYPAGAARLEPIGVLTCAALMGVASFEVIRESFMTMVAHLSNGNDDAELLTPEKAAYSFWSMFAIVLAKLLLLALCKRAAAATVSGSGAVSINCCGEVEEAVDDGSNTTLIIDGAAGAETTQAQQTVGTGGVVIDSTLDALALDHWNDILSNGVAMLALLCIARFGPSFWYVDPVGAVLISVYIIRSWYLTGKEQIEHLTGRTAPDDFIEEILTLATNFDERILAVDYCRAYHFGPNFLVELEIVLPRDTMLFESHDLGMDLQYEIEARPNVERCFVHIDYETRPYDEHVVSKVPELREKYQKPMRSTRSI
jgi:divalent metal cation (Fe/Co/Zn/Cd) transporter